MITKAKHIVCFVAVCLWAEISLSFPVFQDQDTTVIRLEENLAQSEIHADKALVYLKLAKHYGKKNRNGLSFKHYKKAAEHYRKAGLLAMLMECNFEIFYLLDSQQNLENVDALPYLDMFSNFAVERNNIKNQIKANVAYAGYYFNAQHYPKAESYYQKSLNQAKSIKDTLGVAKINTNLGLLYAAFIDRDSAKLYYEKALNLYKPTDKIDIFSTYINYANLHQKEQNYAEAIGLLKEAECIPLTEYRQSYFKVLYGKMANCYEGLQDYKNAFVYLDKYNVMKDSINFTAQNIAISDIEIKYQTAKKEKENLILKTDIQKKRRVQIFLWSGLVLTVLVGWLISYLIFKNAKRKHQIVEQERKLEIQTIEKELNKKELTTIDLMLSRQEKERQRLANNLHDNLGSTLATIKLNIQNLNNHQPENHPRVFESITTLINEAYQKVREIAHEKSSGVMAKEGLLPAVQKLARQFSSHKNLQISVQDFGLENRLENSLEIALYRIIQELVTNIFKHAEATESTISLTNHDSNLNIVVEDNGKGFESKSFALKDGMGLASIEKRVEHLGGTMEIDSSPKHGTSIIINIPL